MMLLEMAMGMEMRMVMGVWMAWWGWGWQWQWGWGAGIMRNLIAFGVPWQEQGIDFIHSQPRARICSELDKVFGLLQVHT